MSKRSPSTPNERKALIVLVLVATIAMLGLISWIGGRLIP